MSRNDFKIRWTKCACAFVGLGLIAYAPGTARASDRPPAAAVDERKSDDSSMTNRDANAAPYSVRLKITGFLARQHARAGDTTRALREFHSMLSVDDPTWPDNEDGDAMRIARDMEVARMMAESGYFDHSVRVLETALVLAQTNNDPQEFLVERMIDSTIELAQLKGLPLSPSEPHASGRAVPAVAWTPEDEDDRDSVESVDASRSEPISTAAAAQSAEPAPNELPDLPRATPKPVPRALAQPVPSKEQHPLIGRLVPSRWRDRESAPKRLQPVPMTAPPPPPIASQQRPMISPNVAPDYCEECAAHGPAQLRQAPATSTVKAEIHHHDPFAGKPQQSVKTVVVKEEPTLRTASAEQSPTASASPAIDPVEKPKRGVLNKLAARRAAKTKDAAGSSSNVKRTTLIASPVVTFPDEPAPKAAETSARIKTEAPDLELTELASRTSRSPAGQITPAAAATSDDTSSDAKKPSAKKNAASPGETSAAASDKSIPDSHDLVDDAEMKGDSDEVTMPDDKSVDAAPALAESGVHAQVGVAGQVTSPGIFAVEGNSTTLAALLRRAGGDPTAKKTRVLRTVELGKPNEASSQKDFYLQRIEVSGADGKLLATPVYGQEVVIVDGDGQRPVYIAVMPHFILQLPPVMDRPTTAHQIIEQLRVYWPNIRNQEIGVLRFEDWGRATKVARVPDDAESIDEPLKGGDVLYVDGANLDGEQVIAAAEAIARIAGAKIRQAK